jgi:hypothetical protein
MHGRRFATGALCIGVWRRASSQTPVSTATTGSSRSSAALVVREVLVDLDDGVRRLVWSVVEGPYSHHNGAAQVLAHGDRTRFVWIADFLPNELAGRTAEAMEQGMRVIKQTLESAAVRG